MIADEPIEHRAKLWGDDEQMLRRWCVEQAAETMHTSQRPLVDEAQLIYDWVTK